MKKLKLSIGKCESFSPNTKNDFDFFTEYSAQDQKIKDNSPYVQYYQQILKIHEDKIALKRSITSNKLNSFRCPELFHLIKDRLHIMPLWSGVMIRQASIVYDNDYLKSISRLSNNYVENYIGQIKRNHGNKRVFPSEFVMHGYKHLISQWVRYNSMVI